MNKSLFSGQMIIVFMTLLSLTTACNKEEDPVIPPSVKLLNESGLISRDTAVAPGQEMHFKVLMEGGDHDITNFMIDVYSENVSNYFDTGMNTSYLVWDGNFIRSLAPEEKWTFTVRDREGNAASVSILLGLDTAMAYHELVDHGAVTPGAQDNPATGGCYAINGGSLYFFGEVAADSILQATIDLLYYFSQADNHTLASPGANVEDGIFPGSLQDWQTRNTTRFLAAPISPEDFIHATNDSIIIANYDEGAAKRKAKDLSIDDVYTFRTENGSLGMFMVTVVDGTNAGSITLHLKTTP